MNGRRLLATLATLVLAGTVLAVLPGSGFAAQAPDAGAAGVGASGAGVSDSAVTVSGTGEFANLKVTVGQTRNLINQTVTVSWSGGVPTLPAGAEFGAQYLQIMQCWGDDPAGPDRTQCQYGGSATQLSPAAGDWVRSRQVNYGASLVDPKESLRQPAGSFEDVYVPFWAAGKDKPAGSATSNRNDFFDSQVTNEIPLARTHGDGTGLEFFEVQTVRQAAGLGCGEPVTAGDVTTGRSCWLVVVPRGNTEVDGSSRNGQGNLNRLESSPLSQTNWEHRMIVPLEFLPVGQSCPLGAPERRVVGHELAADAVSRWQPALCAGGGTLFSYTQLPDEVARIQTLDPSTPGLALVTNSIPPERLAPEHPLVYAPVGLSALTIAFNIEHQPPGNAPDDQLQLDGQRFGSMKLTPRLVAKLLTQSYQGAVVGVPDYLKNNPVGLTVDPEFLELNPEYRGFATISTPPDALAQLNGTDVTSLLWSWVQADQDARAFLNGTPDKFGMVVNPQNKGLTGAPSTFPRNDQSCIDSLLSDGVTKGRICTLDAHPFTNDMHDAGRSASRGDSQARTTVLGSDGRTPTPVKLDRQAPGRRALLAVVDAATASRYGLPTAALRNAAGQFVVPATTSLLAGEAAMRPGAVSDVLVANPAATDPAAYPLTALSYAVTAPSTLEVAAGKDYAAFLRYAAGPGQEPGVGPGRLPFGMAPLPEALRAQARAAAATIEAQAGKAAAGQPGSAAGAGGATGGGAGATAGGSADLIGGAAEAANGTPTDAGAAALPQPGDVQAAGAAADSGGGLGRPVAKSGRTPSLLVPAVGTLLLLILIGGAVAATSSPLMFGLSRWAHRRHREEVIPTEQ